MIQCFILFHGVPRYIREIKKIAIALA